MKNRYGDVYDFVQVDENTYKITGELKYWRCGGREGVEDPNELGFIDPSGGPFIDIGYEIKGRAVTSIRTDKEHGFLLTVE